MKNSLYTLDGVTSLNMMTYQMNGLRHKLDKEVDSIKNIFHYFNLSHREANKCVIEYITENDLERYIKDKISRMKWRSR